MAGVILEEFELLDDPKYRSYVSAIDKALKSFEYTSEWADLISALGKLNKVLLNHAKFQIIPRKITISKRLAQCMHPALPSGVHLKALETYDIIFKCIGSNRLSQELFIYSAGLFPLLANAAMNVKPFLLAVYETHFVPLKEKLTPGLSGFLIGVLPGLEEGSDYYERADSLLLQVCEGVEKSFFYGCMWKCITCNPTIRLPAITFIIAHFNRRLSMEDQLHIIGTDIDSMVQGLCLSLQDGSVLVQRSALDLLLLGFPIHNNQLVSSDMICIVTASITVVLRRDMSLNRRLFSWLFGGDSLTSSNETPTKTEAPLINDADDNCSYFKRYSKDYLLQALQTCFDTTASMTCGNLGSVSHDLWCYRLLVSLLDRPEISSILLDDILIEVLRSLYLKCQRYQTRVTDSSHDKKSPRASNKSYNELIKTANLLFSTLEPWYLWTYCAKVFENACQRTSSKFTAVFLPTIQKESTVSKVGSGPPTISEICSILDFLLDVVSLETCLEARSEHLPDLLCHIADALSSSCGTIPLLDITLTLNLCSKILSKVHGPMINIEEIEAKSTSKLQKTSENVNLQVLKEDKHSGKCEGSILKGDNPVQSPSTISLEDTENMENIPLHPMNLIVGVGNCIQKFQSLFISFSATKLLSNADKTLKQFELLVVQNKSEIEEHEEKLERILHICLKARNRNISKEDIDVFKKEIYVKNSRDVDYPSHLFDEAIQCDGELSEAFKKLCHIILELSSFPTFFTKSRKVLENNFNGGESVELPDWLKLMSSIACFGNSEDIFFTAMSTLLGLIALTKSMTSACEPNHMLMTSSRLSTQPKTVSVVSLPIMTSSQLEYFYEKTALYHVCSIKLWQYVSASHQNHCLIATELLQQIHNLSTDSSDCETIICHSMTSIDEMEQMISLKKFSILWHMTRDLTIKLTPVASSKAFDRCLFLMLDNLGKECGPQKTVAQSWLNHSLQRGDVARFLEPIMLILLHPDSARVSVQRIKIQHKKEASEDSKNESGSELESKIYAISSVGGNIFYHVNDDNHPSSQHISPKKSIFALTSVANGKSPNAIVTSDSMIKDFEQPSSHERDMQLPISVFVNPFWYHSSFNGDIQTDSTDVVNFSQAKRIKVYPKLFDEEVGNDTNADEEVSSDSIIAGIIENIVNQVVESATAENAKEPTFSSSGDFSIEDEYNNFMNFRYTRYNSNNSARTNDCNQDFMAEFTIHPLHTYMLLYSQVYDSQKTLYALHSFKAMFLANPKAMLLSMASTNVNNSLSSRGQQLQLLLIRHRKSISGKPFHGELKAEGTSVHRSNTFIETIILTCLNHIQSYYPKLPQAKILDGEVLRNRNVRMLCCELLTLIFSELVAVVRESGKSFASYLNDIFVRTGVQKLILNSFVSSVFNSQNSRSSSEKLTFTETIVEFNDVSSDGKVNEAHDFLDMFQIHLLRLMATLIVLEDAVLLKLYGDKEPHSTKTLGIEMTSDHTTTGYDQSQPVSLTYQQGMAIPAQPMFLSAILIALQYKNNPHMHIHWLSFVTSALPFVGRWLARLISLVVIQICHNLDEMASLSECKMKRSNQPNYPDVPPDYLITIIEGLTTLCHYCLLESSPVSNLLNSTLLPPVPSQGYVPGTSASQIWSNLMHVFSTSSNEKDYSSARDPAAAVDPILSARHVLLSNFPRLISSVSAAYRIASSMDKDSKTRWIMGTPKIVKQHILGLLSPISLNYGSNFIAAMAVIWHEKRTKIQLQTRKLIPSWNASQLFLVDLVAAIKVLPIDSIVQIVRNVLKQPPQISQKELSGADAISFQNKVPLEVNTLQFFLAYVQRCQGTLLVESWSSLLGLWKDGLQLNSPPVHFHLLAILHEFVQRAPILEDKKAQKDLQDIAHKLVDACSTVASASLEQTTWLWRNLAVRPGPQLDIVSSDPEDESQDSSNANSASIATSTTTLTAATTSVTQEEETTTVSNDDAQYSVQALTILAEYLAPVLDFVYIGEEKDKVLPILSNIMYYVTPYLKNHSSHNAPSFRACCQLLSSISGYQHTRKAWRKDAFDLLLDSSFFQMSINCIGYWRSIADNLMTHDKTTFRDFMTRVSVAQSGSLNLFSSKEQEYEQRAYLLKRLAFVLFCSELDQYHKFMPDIQERLTECLRLPYVPSVHAEVFLCFRVLLLRMSPQHITSLWPVIITEMVQVFTQIEYELCTDTEEFSGGGGVNIRKLDSSHLRRLSFLDSSWVTNACNGLDAHNNPAWLHLYLSVCKLLDMAVALPANILPQFQMYRWAFVGDSPPLSSENNNHNEPQKPKRQDFVPHVARLSKLLKLRAPCDSTPPFVPGQLLLTMPMIHSLLELQKFFNVLSDMSIQQKKSTMHVTQEHDLKPPERSSVSLSKSRSAPELSNLLHSSSRSKIHKSSNVVEQIENILESDFIELSNSPT